MRAELYWIDFWDTSCNLKNTTSHISLALISVLMLLLESEGDDKEVGRVGVEANQPRSVDYIFFKCL